jgi:hypothetical protein
MLFLTPLNLNQLIPLKTLGHLNLTDYVPIGMDPVADLNSREIFTKNEEGSSNYISLVEWIARQCLTSIHRDFYQQTFSDLLILDVDIGLQTWIDVGNYLNRYIDEYGSSDCTNFLNDCVSGIITNNRMCFGDEEPPPPPPSSPPPPLFPPKKDKKNYPYNCGNFFDHQNEKPKDFKEKKAYNKITEVTVSGTEITTETWYDRPMQ